MSGLLATGNTLVAFKKETVSGTYETIGDTNFLPVLNSFTDATGHDSVENAEMTGKLDKKPNRLTTQTGTLEIPIYLKGSNDSGLTPWYQDLLDCAFGDRTNPFAGVNKAIDGDVSPHITEGTPVVGSVDVTAVSTFFLVDDIVKIDTSVAKDGSRTELATIATVTFDTDHDILTFDTDLTNAPQVGADVELVNRIFIDASPGLTVQDGILVDVSATGSGGTYEPVMVTAIIAGTVTQELRIRPCLTAEPVNDAVVLGGSTNKVMQGSQVTGTASVFKDCIDQDGLRKDFAGCRPNLLIENMAVGQLPNIKFSLDALEWQTSDVGTKLATLGLTPDSGPDHDAPICLGVTLTLGNGRTTIEMENFSLDMGYTVAKSKSMTVSSGVRNSRYGERKVVGTFDNDLLNDDDYAAAMSSERPPLVVMFADEFQTIVFILPYIKQLDPAEKDVEGLLKLDKPYECDFTDTIGPMILCYFSTIV